MILSKTVKVQMRSKSSYYRALGYQFRYNEIVDIAIDDLPKQSNKNIECSCDRCGTIFHRSYQMINRDRKLYKEHLCYKCARVEVDKNTDRTTTIEATKTRCGKLHPRWNPNKSEYRKYANEVWRMTRYNYIKHISEINPNDLPRKRCGVERGYQLDHRISVCQGFRENIDPAIIADASNLQMLSWECNRSKSHK